ncbi:MAG: cell division protein FtsZ [Bacteroidetes bacterium]|nr:MAG: cell division protein FtsZ [Bacteroidota bacterium]
MEFDLPKEISSIIKVIGVGGGGSNAVNHMYSLGIKGVDFIVTNTDQQALDMSPVPTRIQLGVTLTQGRGAGSKPEVGKNAAIENIEEIKEILEKNTNMVFITAGMGGGTGTGAAPILADVAREMGILTVGIVTLPFAFEGKMRKKHAEEGIEELRNAVDTLLVIKNDKLREMYGNLGVKQAFGKADDVLTIAAKGIAELISVHGDINVDMNDVISVMKDSGVAIMGTGIAEGPDRASIAVKEALDSPLLNENDITGAGNVLLNITYGKEDVTMDEITEITDYIQNAAGDSANVIWGYGRDEDLESEISITIIATGFEGKVDTRLEEIEPEVIKFPLDQTEPREITETMKNPTGSNPESIEEEELSDPEMPYLKEEGLIEDDTQKEIEFGGSGTESQEIDQENVVKYTLDMDAPQEESVSPKKPKEQRIDKEAFKRRSDERMKRLNDLTNPIHTGKNLREFENVPAYIRKNKPLDETPHSSDSQASRYTLSEEEDEAGKKSTGINPNNSFLHDNVD